MILVDTSVWIDYFGGMETPETAVLRNSLSTKGNVCLCGPVLAESLQGIRNDGDFMRTRSKLSVFPLLPMNRQTYERAAEIYRSLRKLGITIRKPVDCIIASTAIEHGVTLLHRDRDFDPIEHHSELKVYKAAV